MKGRFLVGPHALSRWQIRARPGGTLDDMLREMDRWYRIRDGREIGTGLWRHRGRPRYRVIIDERGPVPCVITVIGECDRGRVWHG